MKDNEAYCFCLSSISQFIIDSLYLVKHTNVLCNLANMNASTLPNFEETWTITSNRLDAIISVALKAQEVRLLVWFSGRVLLTVRNIV